MSVKHVVFKVYQDRHSMSDEDRFFVVTAEGAKKESAYFFDSDHNGSEPVVFVPVMMTLREKHEINKKFAGY